MICQKCGKEFKGTITVICPQCIRKQEWETRKRLAETTFIGKCRICGQYVQELHNGVCLFCVSKYHLGRDGITEQNIQNARELNTKEQAEKAAAIAQPPLFNRVRSIQPVEKPPETSRIEHTEPASTAHPIYSQNPEDTQNNKKSSHFEKDKLIGTLGGLGRVCWYLVILAMTFMPLYFLKFPFIGNVLCIAALIFSRSFKSTIIFGQLLEAGLWVDSFPIVLSMPMGWAPVVYFVSFASYLFTQFIPNTISFILAIKIAAAQRKESREK